MEKKLRVAMVFMGLACWLMLPAGSAFADSISFHCVDVTVADPRFGDCTGTMGDTHGTIQGALNHADSGESVYVGAGTYDEQPVITKPVTLQGAENIPFPNMPLSVIQPASPAVNTTNIVNGAAIAAIVLANGTTGVVVSQFTIDGSFSSGCSHGIVGVFYRGSSGAIENNHVTDIEPGCNTALGIFVQTDKGGSTKATVAIIDNWVEKYGKNGITANQAGTFVTLNGNTITGDSAFTPTPSGPVCDPTKVDIVQNGVQIGFAARGVVTDNIISNHCYSPDTFVACGTLFFKAGGGPGRAQNNDFSGNEGNICNVQGTIGSVNSPFNEN